MGDPIYAYFRCPAPHNTPMSQSIETVVAFWPATYPEYTTLAIPRLIPGVSNPNASIMRSHKNEQSHLVRLTTIHLFSLNRHTASVSPVYAVSWLMEFGVMLKVMESWADK